MAKSEPVNFTTPVGRLVQGSPLEAQTKDQKTGAPLVVKTGPNAGQPTQRYFVAIAIRKDDPQWPAFYQTIYNVGREGYPQHFDPATGACKHPRFTFKIMDGDGVDANGASNAAKQGFAGCHIVKFSSSYAPKMFHNGQYITDPQAIRRGYYVRIAGNAAANIGSDVPGVYLNHNGIELVAYGEEIISGPDVGAMFQAAGAAALPPGAMAAPLAPTMPMPGGMPTPPALTPQAPPANPGFVAGAMPIPPAPAAPQPAFVMTALAQGATREAMHAAGWTDDMMIAQGMMTKGAPPANPGFVAGAMPPAPPAGPKMTALAQGATREAMHAAGWTDDMMIAQGMMTR